MGSVVIAQQQAHTPPSSSLSKWRWTSLRTQFRRGRFSNTRAQVSQQPADLVELLLDGGDRQRMMRLSEHSPDVRALLVELSLEGCQPCAVGLNLACLAQRQANVR